MSSPSPFRTGWHCVSSRCLLAVACLSLAVPFSRLRAQAEHEDHDHDHLHFSHPLVTESPTPDTKLRLDYLQLRISEPIDIRENDLSFEWEYAFRDEVSLSVVAPYVFRRLPGDTKINGLGSIELSLKAASLRFGEHGVLVGGGLSVGLPTGSDEKAIGSGHLVDLEPFVDAGFKRQRLELVGLAAFSTTVRRRTGDEAERSLSLNTSALYHLMPRLEALVEIATSRTLTGSQSGAQQTFIAPGIKIYPFPMKQLMFGLSYEIGVGELRDTEAMLVSGFYHF